MSAAFSAFATWLQNFFPSLLEKLYNIFIDLVQGAIDVVPEFIAAALALISYACPPPDLSALQSNASGASPLFGIVLSTLLETLSWLFPIQFSIYLFQFVVCGLVSYIAMQIILRWLKVTT